MLLAMDTATATASLAVYNRETNVLLAEWTWQARRRQTQDLLIAARQMLAQLQLEPQQLTALAVTTGPGSFTGLRVAISAAKGIGIGLPVAPSAIGIPALCVTAAPWLAPAQAAQASLCACIQAGRGRYNWMTFSGITADAFATWHPTAEDHTAGTARELADDVARLSPTPVWLVGETQPDVRDAVSGMAHVCIIDEVSSWRRAGSLARLASLQLAHGTSTPLSALQPLYLRAP